MPPGDEYRRKAADMAQRAREYDRLALLYLRLANAAEHNASDRRDGCDTAATVTTATTTAAEVKGIALLSPEAILGPFDCHACTAGLGHGCPDVARQRIEGGTLLRLIGRPVIDACHSPLVTAHMV